jgi:multicomponent Na+:H+ antiporter subunit G
MSSGIAVVSMLVGSTFILLAAIGAVRLPDLFMRMHAMTKAGTVGAGFIMVAVASFFGSAAVATKAMGIVFFLALTAPVAAHMISRAAYLSGVKLWRRTFIDQLREAYDEADGSSRADESQRTKPASDHRSDVAEEESAR